MSQIIYSTVSPVHGPIDVQIGWAPSRQVFHVTVWRIGRDHDEEPVFEEDPELPCACLGTFVLALALAGVPVPRKAIKQLYHDKAADDGKTVTVITRGASQDRLL